MIKIQSYKSWCKTKICTTDQLQTILTELIFTETDTAEQSSVWSHLSKHIPLYKQIELIYRIAFTYMWLFSYSADLEYDVNNFPFHDNQSNN